MSARALCLIGAGGHGRVVAAQMARAGQADIVFADEGQPMGSLVDGRPVAFGKISEIQGRAVLVTIGDNQVRQRCQTEAAAAGLELARFVAEPARYYAEAPGQGAQVLAGAVVNPGAAIGAGVIVNSAAVVEHDCMVGDFAHVCPGAVMGGGARIGARVLLGSNATLRPGVSVCDDVVIGAGAVVVADIRTAGVYMGVPARGAG